MNIIGGLIFRFVFFFFFFSSRRRHTRCSRDWSSDVCSSDHKIFLSIVVVIILFFSYLSIPNIFNQSEISAQLKKNLLKKLNLEFNFEKKLNYKFLPRPHFITNKSSIIFNENKISEINKLKIYVSLENLFSLKNVKVQDVIIEEGNFNLNKKNHWFFIKLLDSDFKDINLKVINTEVFHTPGGQKLPIHIDDWKEDDHVKINISWGPPEGTTRWWKPNNFDINEYDGSHNSNQDVNKLDYSNFSDRHHKSIIKTEEECKLVYEANTDKPSLVNVGTFHSSYNPTEQGRWTLCFVLGYGLDDLLSWDKAENIFKDYIE